MTGEVGRREAAEQGDSGAQRHVAGDDLVGQGPRMSEHLARLGETLRRHPAKLPGIGEFISATALLWIGVPHRIEGWPCLLDTLAVGPYNGVESFVLIPARAKSVPADFVNFGDRELPLSRFETQPSFAGI